ncbi:hypothetical protein HK097_010901 [Rhizophlyctis rosea]|uniref:NADH dehydrogenase [ubiquinone] 1 alpha subcomplex assembly factor 3 n=1 Tax=Rhizophlyctis rosea TaxID=64517 RepID=A0AAD5S9C3_9FUNG|nr:hypothetical protein HK097_010901 [Rhizophlyctis rosea]
MLIRRLPTIRLPSSLPTLPPVTHTRPYSATIRSSSKPTPQDRPTLLSKTPEEKLAPLTQFNIIQTPQSARLFTSVTNTGFQLSDVAVEGPLMLLNSRVFMWDVPQYGVGGIGDLEAEVKGGGEEERWADERSPFYGWGTDMFKILEVAVPSPDILVIGTGGTMAFLPPFLRKYIHSLGIQVEVQATRAAASTYNVLLAEGRRPGAAMLPMIPTSARTSEQLVKLSLRGPRS